jgi:serine/threonine protein phosphatase 1
MRKHVIGDIRGDLDLLKKLMDRIGPSEDDSLIFLGSYIGPGSDSKGVMNYVLDIQKRFSRTFFIRGCYEWLFDFCVGDEPPSVEYQKLWSTMGGNQVFKSYTPNNRLLVMSPVNNYSTVEVKLDIPITHVRFMEKELGHWYEDDTFPYICCHSGGHPQLFGGVLENEVQTVFSERDWWKCDGRSIPGKTVIFSHYPFQKPFRGVGKIGIDLGAGLGGKLAAFEMMSETITIVGR